MINTDGDSYMDYLDTDSDNDGLPDLTEGSSDSPLDADAVPNYQDIDSDGDGINDIYEGASDSTLDTDADPNYLDLDSDGDGISDQTEGGRMRFGLWIRMIFFRIISTGIQTATE